MAPSGLLATSQFVSDGLSIFLPTIAFGIAQQFTPISLTVNSTWPLVASGVGIVIGIYYVKVASPKFFGISLVLYTVQYSFLTAWTLTSFMGISSIIAFFALNCIAYIAIHLILYAIIIRRVEDEELGPFGNIARRFGTLAEETRDFAITLLAALIQIGNAIIHFATPAPQPSENQAIPMPLVLDPSSQTETPLSVVSDHPTASVVSPPSYYDLELAYNNLPGNGLKMQPSEMVKS